MNPGKSSLLIGLAWLACATASQAQDAQILRTRSLAATCGQCHGTDGHAIEAAALPGLAGLPASYVVEQMSSFKSGTRPATVMHRSRAATATRKSTNWRAISPPNRSEHCHALAPS